MIRTLLILSFVVLACGCHEASQTAASGKDKDPKPTLLVAQRYVDAGQFDEAQAILAAALESWPNEATVHELLARVDFGRGLSFNQAGLMEHGKAALREALGHWSTACTLLPKAAQMRVSAGDVAAMIGETAQAKSFYAHALTLDPAHGRAALCLAQLEMHDHPDLARSLLTQSLEHAGEVPEVYASLALLHARGGEAQAARDSIDRAIELGPLLQGIRVMQARVERLLGDPARSIEILTALGPEAGAGVAVAWEAAACWTELDRPDRAATAWVACFLANAHRSDAGDLAAKAAKAFEAAGNPLEAQTWWRQAGLLGVQKDVESSGGS
jgi:tetratricopeptide (TPR) repeat protein